jgi:hypothetical protein
LGSNEIKISKDRTVGVYYKSIRQTDYIIWLNINDIFYCA